MDPKSLTLLEDSQTSNMIKRNLMPRCVSALTHISLGVETDEIVNQTYSFGWELTLHALPLYSITART